MPASDTHSPDLLIRTPLQTFGWIVGRGTRHGTKQPAHSRGRRADSTHPVTLERARRDGLRWLLRSPLWGPLMITATACVGAACGVLIHLTHAEVLGAADAFVQGLTGWLVEQIGTLPGHVDRLLDPLRQ